MVRGILIKSSSTAWFLVWLGWSLAWSPSFARVQSSSVKSKFLAAALGKTAMKRVAEHQFHESELNRVVGFGSVCFVWIHSDCQLGGFHPHLTTHVLSQQKRRGDYPRRLQKSEELLFFLRRSLTPTTAEHQRKSSKSEQGRSGRLRHDDLVGKTIKVPGSVGSGLICHCDD